MAVMSNGREHMGGPKDDAANAVAIAPNGDIIVAGYTMSFGEGTPLHLNAWILRLPPNGVLRGFSANSYAVVILPTVNIEKPWMIVKNSTSISRNSYVYPVSARLTTETQWPVTFAIASNPPEAKVYVDGEYYGTTPVTFNLTPGQYTIELIKKGYENYTSQIDLNPGEHKSITVVLTPSFGYLSINSSPLGAKIYLNGSYIGKTPLTNYRLHTGRYTVKIVKEGYKEFTTTVTIKPGERTNLTTRLVTLSITRYTSLQDTQITNSKKVIYIVAALLVLWIN